MPKFDFDAFLNTIKDMDFYGMHDYCQSTIFEAERKRDYVYVGKKRKNYPDEVYQLKDYISKLKGFAFFLMYCKKADGISYNCFMSFYPIIKNLVDKGNLKASALDSFGFRDS